MAILNYNGKELEVHSGARGGVYVVPGEDKKRYLNDIQISKIQYKDGEKQFKARKNLEEKNQTDSSKKATASTTTAKSHKKVKKSKGAENKPPEKKNIKKSVKKNT